MQRPGGLSGFVVPGRQLPPEQADAAGNFSIPGLCPGSYTLLVSHVGCDPVQRKVEIRKGLPDLKR